MQEINPEKTEVLLDEKPELDNPIFIEGLTGIGHVGRTTVKYLIDSMETTKFGKVLSPHFPHWSIINDDKEINLLKNKLYYYKAQNEEEKDIIFLTGNAQAVNPEGHYNLAHAIMDLIRDLEVSKIITVGGFGTGDVVDNPDVLGVVTDKSLKDDYEEYDITFDHSVGQIVGASGLILGVGKHFEIDGICLLGETPGFLLSDPKATEEVLKVLTDILNLDIDYSNLEEKIEEEKEVLKKVEKLKKKAKQGDESGGQEDLGYIG